MVTKNLLELQKGTAIKQQINVKDSVAVINIVEFFFFLVLIVIIKWEMLWSNGLQHGK